MIAHLLHMAGGIAMAAFVTLGGPFMGYNPALQPSEKSKLIKHVEAGAFSDCETDSEIVQRARQLGLNVDKLHRAHVFPF